MQVVRVARLSQGHPCLCFWTQRAVELQIASSALETPFFPHWHCDIDLGICCSQKMVWFFSLCLNMKAKTPEIASDMGKPVLSVYLGFYMQQWHPSILWSTPKAWERVQKLPEGCHKGVWEMPIYALSGLCIPGTWVESKGGLMCYTR